MYSTNFILSLMEESKGKAFVCKQSFVLFFVLFSLVSSAQNLEQRFIVFPQQKVIRLEEINIVSNVVLIRNNANTEVRFSLDATMPKGGSFLVRKQFIPLMGTIRFLCQCVLFRPGLLKEIPSILLTLLLTLQIR